MRPCRWLRVVLLLWVCAFVWAWPASARSDDDTAARLRKQQAHLSRIREKIKAVAEDIEQSRARKSGLEQSLRETEQRISETARDIDRLEERVKAQNERLAHTRQSIDATRSDLADQRKALAAQIRAAYFMGRQERIKLLLSQQNPATVGRVMIYYDYYNRARKQVIQGMQSQLQTLADLRDSLRQQTEKLAALKSDRGKALVSLKAAQKSRGRVIAELAARIESGNDRLSGLRADEKELETLLQRLHQALAQAPPPPTGRSGPFSSLKGDLPWPLKGPLLARFGADKAGAHMQWEGIWIGADSGTPVHAVAAGRVVFVGWMHRYGLMVIVAHDGGYYSLYAHDQVAYVHIGDEVRAGQRIAAAGSTGGHSDTGVYFEIRKGKTPLNPLSWLQG